MKGLEMSTEEFRELLGQMRPLISTVDYALGYCVMSWLRLLTCCDPPDHLLRNAVLLELHSQILDRNVQSPFTEAAPSCGIREVDWKSCTQLFEVATMPWQPLSARIACGVNCKVVHCERDDASQWSDCTSGVTVASSVASVHQWRCGNAGMGDARGRLLSDRNTDHGSPQDSICAGSSVSSYFPPDTPSCMGEGQKEGEEGGGGMCSSCTKLPDRAALVQHYETIVAQLRADLLREKTVSFQSINGLAEEQRHLEDKIAVLESQRRQLEVWNRDALEGHKQRVGQATYRLRQMQELYGKMEERVRDAAGRLEELEHQEADVSKQQSSFIQESRQILRSEVSQQTQLIRQEFIRRHAKKDAHFASKLGDLRKTIQRSAVAKQMWAEEYERRIEYAELEKDFEMKRMTLQLQAERQELETVARKFRQGDLQRIQQLQDKLESVEKI